MNENTTVTLYAAAKIVNALLAEDGITNSDGTQKKINPQMMYGYARKGYIKVDGEKKVSLGTIKEWYLGYVENGSTNTTDTQEATETVRLLINRNDPISTALDKAIDGM